MSVVETVKRICLEAAKALSGAEIIAPLPVWDGARGAMGVQIKAPRQMGPMACEVTAGFVLEPAELAHEHMIRSKANAAVACMTKDIQVQIKPAKRATDRPNQVGNQVSQDKVNAVNALSDPPLFIGKEMAL